MEAQFEKAMGQAAAMQKVWMESMSRMMQAAFSVKPTDAPPEVVRQIRAGMFQALAQSWDEFMRSPQFLEGMRQWMDQAVSFRKMTNEFLARARAEMQAPSGEDTDSIMLTVRHMEKRLLDRLDELEARVAALNGGAARRPAPANARKGRRVAPARGKRPAKGPGKL